MEQKIKEFIAAFNDIFDTFNNQPTPDDIDYYNNKLFEYYILHRMERKLEKTTNGFTLTPYLWLTINPPDNISINTAQTVIQKFLKKKKITSYLYVIEQRGFTDTTIGVGTHYHILFNHTYTNKYELVRETHNTFKKIINIESSHVNNFIKYKDCKTDHDVKKRVKYILGNKDGIEKQEKQKYDKIFRQKNNLANYYSNNAEALLQTNIS